MDRKQRDKEYGRIAIKQILAARTYHTLNKLIQSDGQKLAIDMKKNIPRYIESKEIHYGEAVKIIRLLAHLNANDILQQASCQRLIEQLYCSVPPRAHVDIMLKSGKFISDTFRFNCRPYWRAVYYWGKCHDFQHQCWDELIQMIANHASSPTHHAYIEERLATELYDHFYQLKKANKTHDNEWLPKFIDRYRLVMGYTPVCFISPLLMSRHTKLTNDKYVARLFKQTRRPQIQLYAKIEREAIIALAFKFTRY